jgi:hypothetical protein
MTLGTRIVGDEIWGKWKRCRCAKPLQRLSMYTVAPFGVERTLATMCNRVHTGLKVSSLQMSYSACSERLQLVVLHGSTSVIRAIIA